MTYLANHLVSEQGKLRRVLASCFSFLQAMDSTGLDYTLDRVERLEREVEELKEDLRQSRKSGRVDARDDSAVGLAP